jgi:hypothetical protein
MTSRMATVLALYGALATTVVLAKPPQTPYEHGLLALHQKQWSDAIASLEASYRATPTAMTAYLLAYCYSRDAHLSDVRKWARVALRERPKLATPYRDGAVKLIAWADGLETMVFLRLEQSDDGASTSKDIVSMVAEEEARLPADSREEREKLQAAYDRALSDVVLNMERRCGAGMGVEQLNRQIEKLFKGDFAGCIPDVSVRLPTAAQ